MRALFATRLTGIAVLAIAVGDVFGGASILACAADRLAMLPSARLGVSGPKVIESVHGKWELDAERAGDVDAVFGARARASRGGVDQIADDADAISGWIRMAAANVLPFGDHVARTHAQLETSSTLPSLPRIPPLTGASAEDKEGYLWRIGDVIATRHCADHSLGPDFSYALDSALLAKFGNADAKPTLAIVEDSAGHEVSRAAEMRFISRYLAHHAAVLALLRDHGVRVVALLAGNGHSAAFFVNGLQADLLYALPQARVVAMEPAAIARVTGVDVATLIEDDLMLGQPVKHFAALGGVEAIVDIDEFLRRVGAEPQ